MSVVVLISGRGSNMQAILEAGIPVSAVVSNRADAAGLAIAAQRGVATAVVEHRHYASREAFDAALAAEVERHAPRLVALAGFMRILTPGFVARFEGRIMNIHPALLPAFKGLHAQRQALEYGVKIAGATVHFVDEHLDHGPIIIQGAVPVAPDDTEETVLERILRVEHEIYPTAIQLYAEGRLAVEGRRVRVRGGSPPGGPQVIGW